MIIFYDALSVYTMFETLSCRNGIGFLNVEFTEVLRDGSFGTI